MDRFPAITLHQPWAHLVAHHGKDIENRTWPPPAKLIGRRIAIHAAKYTPSERRFSAATWLKNREIHVRAFGHEMRKGCVVAVATISGALKPSPDVETNEKWWITGHYGWLLDQVVALKEPIPCKGAQRIWYLPDDVAEKVRAADPPRPSVSRGTP